jgi:hypothetical protein
MDIRCNNLNLSKGVRFLFQVFVDVEGSEDSFEAKMGSHDDRFGISICQYYSFQNNLV